MRNEHDAVVGGRDRDRVHVERRHDIQFARAGAQPQHPAPDVVESEHSSALRDGDVHQPGWAERRGHGHPEQRPPRHELQLVQRRFRRFRPRIGVRARDPQVAPPRIDLESRDLIAEARRRNAHQRDDVARDLVHDHETASAAIADDEPSRDGVVRQTARVERDVLLEPQRVFH
ncbi:MAG: hypothetical protein DMF85_07155 [Acidobacteria bacterium]|nr:MAG: hypothetical protein DMF85_07155 [Acidobacteriota bacterium]